MPLTLFQLNVRLRGNSPFTKSPKHTILTTLLPITEVSLTTMKFLYLVDYWVPFPSSEYGGTISVVARDDEECFDILAQASSEFGEIDGEKYKHLIAPKVATAQRFQLANEEEECGIVDAFTT